MKLSKRMKIGISFVCVIAVALAGTLAYSYIKNRENTPIATLKKYATLTMNKDCDAAFKLTANESLGDKESHDIDCKSKDAQLLFAPLVENKVTYSQKTEKDTEVIIVQYPDEQPYDGDRIAVYVIQVDGKWKLMKIRGA